MAEMWCANQTVINVQNLGNAVQMNISYPNLNIPNYQQIEAIEPDDTVELTHQGDRFWAKVDSVNVDTCEFIGKVTDGLAFNNHPFTLGDCILFEGSNILNIHGHEWNDALRITPNE